MENPTNSPKLERTLGPVMLWGLGVGYVISGMYFGWNLGLAEGGTLGLAIATFFIIIMYVISHSATPNWRAPFQRLVVLSIMQIGHSDAIGVFWAEWLRLLSSCLRLPQ